MCFWRALVPTNMGQGRAGARMPAPGAATAFTAARRSRFQEVFHTQFDAYAGAYTARTHMHSTRVFH